MDLSAAYKIICYCLAAYNISKDAHYNAKYNSFYGNHLFADRLADKWLGYIDDIKEIFYVGNETALGEENLIGDIDQLVQNNKGLLWRATLG